MRYALLLVSILAALLMGCKDASREVYQGYVEGDYVYVASKIGGRLETLNAAKGETVSQGQTLYALEREYEAEGVRQAEARMQQAEAQIAEAVALVRQAAAQMEQAQGEVNQAKATVRQAQATARDLKTGLRQEELDQIAASLRRAQVALKLSERELKRRKDLFAQGIISREDLDRAESSAEADRAAVGELEAKLAAGKLPGRSEQIIAAEAEQAAAGSRLEQARAGLEQAQAQQAQTRAGMAQAQAAKVQAEAGLAQARWTLDQKTQQAPVTGLIFDLLYQIGDWVPAGSPVAALLPPENIKVRFFIPQEKLSAIRQGLTIFVDVDGNEKPVEATVNYISTQPEYTPPVIYGQNFRDKLVFMVEARFDKETAVRMHPGQPVDVRLQ